MSPPWLTGNVLGTITATARIGDVLLSAGPGEMYPQIALKVAELVGARGHMTAGLANDQLGYLIAPFEAYPEPIRRSFFNYEGDEVSPIDNDNYFFNVSHTMGDRVTCSLLRGAGETARHRQRVPRAVPAVCAVRERPAALARGGRAGARPPEASLEAAGGSGRRCAGARARRPPRSAEVYRDGPVQADVGATSIELSNAQVSRRWTRAPFRTEALVDRRGARPRVEHAGRGTSRCRSAGLELGSEAFTVESVSVTKLARGGLRVTMRLGGAAALPGVAVTRVAEAYPGVAGFRTQTVIESTVPLVLDEGDAGRGGADRRR